MIKILYRRDKLLKMNKQLLLNNIQQSSRKYSDTSLLMHEAIARKAGLSGTDHKYLGIIIERGETTAGEIAKLTGLTSGATTAMIDRLEKMKLVTRKSTESDRRKVMVIPNTRYAMKLLSPIFATLQEKTQKLLDGFSEKQLETLDSYFTDALTIMNEMTDQLNNKTK
jgi:DNA-binding MarR family transcriptional regulator